jgi:hypothetical protein
MNGIDGIRLNASVSLDNLAPDAFHQDRDGALKDSSGKVRVEGLEYRVVSFESDVKTIDDARRIV